MQEDHKFEYSLGYLMIPSPQKKYQYYTPMKTVPSSSITRKGHPPSTSAVVSLHRSVLTFHITQVGSNCTQSQGRRKECKWLPRRAWIKRKPRAYPQFPRFRSVGTGLRTSTLAPQRLWWLSDLKDQTKRKKKTPRQNIPALLPSAFWVCNGHTLVPWTKGNRWNQRESLTSDRKQSW